MQQNATGTEFRWTKKAETAAQLVADDKLTDEKIAETLGIDRVTLHRWKQNPDFQARIAEHVAAWRSAVMSQGVADKSRRIERLNTDWQDLKFVKDSRSRRYIAARKRSEETLSKATTDDDAETAMRDLLGTQNGDVNDDAGEQDDFVTCDNIPEEAESGLVILTETPTKMGVKREWAIDNTLLAGFLNIEKQAAIELGQWSEKQEIELRDTTSLDALKRRLVKTEGSEGSTEVPVESAAE